MGRKGKGKHEIIPGVLMILITLYACLKFASSFILSFSQCCMVGITIPFLEIWKQSLQEFNHLAKVLKLEQKPNHV